MIHVLFLRIGTHKYRVIRKLALSLRHTAAKLGIGRGALRVQGDVLAGQSSRHQDLWSMTWTFKIKNR